MSKCVIQFDQNEFGTYFTGQVVTGRVIINMNKAKKMKGIKLQICGYACAQWQHRHGKRPRKVKKHKKHVYYGREDYIASTTYLVGSDGGDPFIMDGGSHTYSFACPIPVNCPSSFEGTFGHIRYLAKVTFIRSGSSNRTNTVGFTVLKLLDLNQESRLLKAPANNEAMENFCLLQTKAVSLKVDITQTGYVPGQVMLVSVHVDNESNFDCRRLTIFLNLRATYTSDTPRLLTTSEKICLVRRFCGPVQRCSSKDFAETIRIPATPPTCEHLSKVVRVSYEVCVVAEMNRLMRNPKTVIPITIGNVPLTGGATSSSSANGVSNGGAPAIDRAPRADDVPTTSSCAMQLAGGDDHRMLSEVTRVELELPPPTYEEAMFMTAEISEHDDDGNVDGTAGPGQRESVRFTPRYPVYDVDAMLAAGAQESTAASYPVKPQKRRRRKKKGPKAQEAGEAIVEEERAPVESPVQI